jgi:hypothetical protein
LPTLFTEEDARFLPHKEVPLTVDDPATFALPRDAVDSARHVEMQQAGAFMSRRPGKPRRLRHAQDGD